MGWKKNFGKKKNTGPAAQIDFFFRLNEKMKERKSITMKPREFEGMTGLHLEKEVRGVVFSPDRTLGDPDLDGNRQLVINGFVFLDILHRDLFPHADGESEMYDPDKTTWEVTSG